MLMKGCLLDCFSYFTNFSEMVIVCAWWRSYPSTELEMTSEFENPRLLVTEYWTQYCFCPFRDLSSLCEVFGSRNGPISCMLACENNWKNWTLSSLGLPWTNREPNRTRIWKNVCSTGNRLQTSWLQFNVRWVSYRLPICERIRYGAFFVQLQLWEIMWFPVHLIIHSFIHLLGFSFPDYYARVSFQFLVHHLSQPISVNVLCNRVQADFQNELNSARRSTVTKFTGLNCYWTREPSFSRDQSIRVVRKENKFSLEHQSLFQWNTKMQAIPFWWLMLFAAGYPISKRCSQYLVFQFDRMHHAISVGDAKYGVRVTELTHSRTIIRGRKS